MVKQNGFGKAEKLKSRKAIDALFARGSSLSAFPLRVKYRLLPADGMPGVEAGVTVSKKYFKRAVDRNRLKRLMREAYRLQKAPLLQQVKEKGLKGMVFFIYTDKTIADFSNIHAAMAQCLQNLQQKATDYENAG